MERVSIITPHYNSWERLIECVKNVQSQSYPYYEHIIIDDCSTIGMPEELESLITQDEKIRFIQRTWNAGAAITRNRGISEASGRYIAFLDSDDLWYSTKLEEQIKFMSDFNVDLCYSSYEVINSEGKCVSMRVPDSSITYSDILKSNQIGCLTAVYDTKMLGKVYMPNIYKRQDMALWLKILKKQVRAQGIIEKPLAKYRVGAKSLSSNKSTVLKYQWRLYREIEKIGLLKSMYYFSHYALNGLLKSSFRK